MGLLIMKAICVVGIILNVAMMLKKNAEMKANPEIIEPFGMTGAEMWEEQKKHRVPTAIVGFLANFFDTLGIGSFAPSSSAFKMTKSVDDALVPGTLNVGDTVPVCVEAFLFFGLIEMDILTLVTMIVASVVGAYTSAGIVSKFDRKKVRIAMFIGLFLLATVMLMRTMGVGPFGIVGEAVGLRGVKLVIAIVVNFVLGALMSIGVGLYAPCMALCAVLGLNVGCAFPAMMGSCAFLMAFGNGPKFIQEGRYDMYASLMQALFGAAGVAVAYFLVKSLPLAVLLKLVIAVCYLTSILYLKDAITKGSEA